MNRTVRLTILGVAGAIAVAGFILQDPRFSLRSPAKSEAEKPLPDGSVGVTVRENGEDCLVSDRPVPCAQIGSQLRDVLKIPGDAPIVVTVEGAQDSMQRARRARQVLIENEFSNVTSVTQSRP